MSEPTPAVETNEGERGGARGDDDADNNALAALADEFLRRHRAGEHPTVDEYARQHPALAQQIRELFPAMLMMEDPAAGAAAPTADLRPLTERLGTSVGRYKLLQQIGEGGMGVVFLAEQTHPIRRQVALKIIKAGMDTRQVIARFEAERQALAVMDHPNIARVLDAGVTETGRPYFVMELVKGLPITKYCDDHRLTPRQRLELFVQVCQAIQHAHTKGIIHRDLKPTNVLVALYDGKPVPKVIDFGVAKATGQQLTERTLFTQFGAVVGTPTYMSPEQAELNQLDIDTRSDIYSLGVLLYELLTGTTPLEQKRVKEAALAEVLRVIREEEPPRPSTRLTSAEQLPTIAAQRGLEPKQLAVLVKGELDWIVMKALEKDRTHRYETANGLAMDVMRYLHDEQVLACPPSAAYRLRKIARKHRVPLAVAGAFLLLLVAGAVVSTYQALRIRTEQRNTLAQKLEADQQRDEADRNRKAAQANERLAQERLVQGLTSAGDALLSSNQIIRARLAYLEAIDDARKQGLPAAAATSGLAYSFHLSPASLMRMQISEGMSISSVLFAPDGKTVAYVGGTVTLTPTATTAPTSGPATATATATATAPTTTPTTVASHTGTIWLFDVVTGAIKSVLRGHTGQVSSLVFSRDGKLLLTGSDDGTARLWDVAAQEELWRLDARARIRVVAFTPDEKQVVIAAGDQMVRVWDVRARSQLRAIGSGGTDIWTMALSPDGKLMALGGLSGQLNVYDFATGEVLPVSKRFPTRGQINNLVFTPDGAALLAAYWDHTLTLWDVRSGAELQRFYGPKANPRRGVFSRDGGRLVTTFDDGSIRIWDVTNGQELKTFARFIGSAVVDLSPDGRLIATSDLRLWDASGETDQSVFSAHERGVTCAALSPDGRLALTGDEIGFVKLWDTTTFKEIRTILAHGLVETVAFLPDGRRALTAGRDEDIKLWDLLDGRQLRTFPSRNKSAMGATRCVALSPDGQMLVVPAEAGAQLYEVETGRPVRTVPLSGALTCVDFSPDGKTFLAGQYLAGTASLCDVATGQVIRTFAHGGGLASVCFAPDGKSALTTGWDGTAVHWDLAPGAGGYRLIGHGGVVWCGRFSPDGALAITGSTDRSVRLWDLRSRQEIRAFPGHEATVRCVGFLGQGRAAYSGSIDGSFRLWRLGWTDEYFQRYGRMNEAQQTLAKRPNDPAALAEIGQWYAFRGQWDWAAMLLQRSRAAGGMPSALTLAHCYWRLNKAEEAREEFARAERAGEASAAYLSLAKSALRSGADAQDSTEVMLRALQGEPSYKLLGTANLHAYRLRQRNDMKNALRLRSEVVEAAKRKWPGDFPVLMRYQIDLAELFMTAGDDNGAEAVVRAVALSDKYPAFTTRANGILARIGKRTGRSATATSPTTMRTPPSSPTAAAAGAAWTEEMITSASLEATKLRADNRLAESENVQRQTIEQAKRIWPATSSNVTIMQGTHAALLARLKRFGEAETLYREIYAARMSEADQTSGKRVLVELSKLYELSDQPAKHAEVQKLLAEPRLPARLPPLLADGAASATKPAAGDPRTPSSTGPSPTSAAAAGAGGGGGGATTHPVPQ